MGGIGGLIAGALVAALTGNIVLAAAWNGGVLVAGFVWGYCFARFFGRLQVHQERVCATGLVRNPHRAAFAGEILAAPFMWDPDFVWDLVPISEHQSFVFNNATHPRCTDEGTPLLHCEIDSAIKTAACIGGMIGSAVGAALGIILGAALVAACGPFVFLCAILAFLLAAVLAYVGSWLGGVIGAAAGAAIDWLTGAGDEFETIEEETCIAVTGRWAIDLDHGWNEIHPVAFFSRPARDTSGNPLHGVCPMNLCPLPVIE